MFNALSSVPVKLQDPVAKGLAAAGVLLLLLSFGMLMLGLLGESEKTRTECNGQLWWQECVEHTTPKVEPSAGALVFGILVLGLAFASGLAALKLTTIQGRLKRYVAILTGVEYIGIQQIASITNSSPAVVRDDIQNMIDSEMISDFFINYQTDQVVSKKYIPKTSYKTVERCPHCGAYNDVIIGITRTCAFCAQPLALR